MLALRIFDFNPSFRLTRPIRLFTTATLLGAGAKFAAATKQAQQPPPQQKQAKQ
jgi:hypothetical protein